MQGRESDMIRTDSLLKPTRHTRDGQRLPRSPGPGCKMAPVPQGAGMWTSGGPETFVLLTVTHRLQLILKQRLFCAFFF